MLFRSVAQRAAWRTAAPVLFGHALLEKLVQPRKAITAHVWLAPCATEAADWWAGPLDRALLAVKPWLPLPVLGVPGWWPDNEMPAYYDDPKVFRPVRAAWPKAGAAIMAA